MKLNLGCGPDVKEGYVNVDFQDMRENVLNVDLTKLPWEWADDSVDEILMFDLLEHFPYKLTNKILDECWRVMKVGAHIEIQVPDFEHCAMAAMGVASSYMCNVCGSPGNNIGSVSGVRCCAKCKTPASDIAEAAINRLYGGQNVEGNFHYNAFTKESLTLKLKNTGFKDMMFLEKHHQWMNWNFKISATKTNDAW